MFYKKNKSLKYPNELSHAEIGKLSLLMDYISEDNEIKKTNNSYPTTKDLMEFMRITDESSLKKLIKKLKDLNFISEDIRKKDYRNIFINPKYVLSSNFSLKQIHVDMFGEELFNMYFETTKDLDFVEKYKHLLNDVEYQKIIFKLNPKKYYTVFDYPLEESGIYVLFNNYNVVYIGKSDNMKNRINQHKKDKHFNNVKCILFKDKGMVNLYEPYLIQKYNPIYNKDLIDKTDMCLPDISFYNKGEDTVWKN